LRAVFYLRLPDGRRIFTMEKGRGSFRDVFDRVEELRRIREPSGGCEVEIIRVYVRGNGGAADKHLLVNEGRFWRKEPMPRNVGTSWSCGHGRGPLARPRPIQQARIHPRNRERVRKAFLESSGPPRGTSS
jgi:hypothetical protein